MTLVPITIREASRFVDGHDRHPDAVPLLVIVTPNAATGRRHRHHDASRGGRFALAAKVDDRLVGVVLAGRPVARMLNDGFTIEVTRCCTDGTRNACSFLYGAAVRVAVAMGYRRIVTYTRADEAGASLRGAGFLLDGLVPGHTWSRKDRRREASERIDKQRWLRTTTVLVLLTVLGCADARTCPPWLCGEVPSCHAC